MTGGSDRRAFLERSLADLDREHDAGDLTDGDYEKLRGQYERRLRQAGDRPRRSAAPPGPRRKPAFVVASFAFVLAVAIGAGVLLAQSSGTRTARGQITGGGPNSEEATPSTLPPELAECTRLEQDDAGAALDCYLTYRSANPEDPEAVTALGLFSVRQGFASDAPELIDAAEGFFAEAVRLDPQYAPVRAYQAFLYVRTGRLEEGRAALAALDALPDVPADLLAFVEPLRAEVE